MKTEKDTEKLSKYYDNKNAHTNCPDCDSLNTFYHKNTLYCKECDSEFFVRILDKKTIAKLLKTASFAVILGLLVYLIA